MNELAEKIIFAAMSQDVKTAKQLMDEAPFAIRTLLDCGLQDFLEKHPVADSEVISLVQDFVRSGIDEGLLKDESTAQETIELAIDAFRLKIFPQDIDVKVERLKGIFEKLLEQMKDILNKNYPDDLISKHKLTQRILEVTGCESHYAYLKDDDWIKSVKLVADIFTSGDLYDVIGKRNGITPEIMFKIKNEVINRIKEAAPELADVLTRLSRYKRIKRTPIELPPKEEVEPDIETPADLSTDLPTEDPQIDLFTLDDERMNIVLSIVSQKISDKAQKVSFKELTLAFLSLLGGVSIQNKNTNKLGENIMKLLLTGEPGCLKQDELLLLVTLEKRIGGKAGKIAVAIKGVLTF